MIKFDGKHNKVTTFNQLFTQYQERFIRLASSYINNDMAAEDIVMEAIIYCWENRSRLDFNDNLPAYIFTTIKHKCLNYLRDSKYELATDEELQKHYAWKQSLQINTLEACNPQELLTSEMQMIIYHALNKLPKTTREIFIKSRFRDKTYLEIASESDLSVKGVEYHIKKATTLLRKQLKEYMPLLLIMLRLINYKF